MGFLSPKRGILRRLGTAYSKVVIRLRGDSPGDPIVIDPHRAIYLAVPRVASKSVRAVVADLLGIKTNVSMYAVSFPHVNKNKIREHYPDYFTFGFVRDPWDRVASVYFGKVRPGKYLLYLPRLTMLPIRPTWVYSLLSKLGRDRISIPLTRGPLITPSISFDDFVELVAQTPDPDIDPHLRSQHLFMTDERGELLADFVGRSETLGEEFAKIRQSLGVETIDVPRLGATKGHKGTNYSKYYTERTWELIRRRFREDIEMFGYDPAYRAARHAQ